MQNRWPTCNGGLYRDPVLAQLIRTALQQNYDVQIALARVDEFRAQAGSRRLGFDPAGRRRLDAGNASHRSTVGDVDCTS